MEFAPTVVAKLREMAELHRDLSRQLADPEVASDHRRYTELLREQGGLEEANRLSGELDRPAPGMHSMFMKFRPSPQESRTSVILNVPKGYSISLVLEIR